MAAARKHTDVGLFAVSGEGRAVSLFRLVLGFMAVVMLAFVLIEGWRIWRDYRQAFGDAENAVTNLARATA
ncbi:diguanylate cyclase, partial [Pseudomonas sp. PAH14]|nr:diguanylate cyclase [Pseudomonas sp. PAH14]